MSNHPDFAPETRIGDAEREAAAETLGDHYAAGRLTKPEYDERAEAVWAARTASDLRPLFVDLPSVHGQRRSSSPAPPAAPSRPTGRRRHFAGLPLLPLLAVLVGVALFTGAAPWMLFVLAWLLFCGRRWTRNASARHTSARHTRGSDLAERGRCS